MIPKHLSETGASSKKFCFKTLKADTSKSILHLKYYFRF